MNDHLIEAVVHAAEHGGGPHRVWNVGFDAVVHFGTGQEPFEGLTVTHWTVD
ncbi:MULTISPECIES: hypothetical protein [Rhodococcus]|uniref:hypothetical protein n=1 Tax=Rhodococcus TaxID=1827 RepID=UPI001585FC81|nr:hypothetical protein [Rhodococcus globerulus]